MTDLIKKLAESIDAKEIKNAKETAEFLAMGGGGGGPLVMIALD